MIAYSQCWEDASLVIKALQIDDKDIVLSITSGGCNTLAIAGLNPRLIYSVDNNPSQNFLLELKLAAIKNLSFNIVLEFLGYRRCNNRSEVFKLLLPYLGEESRQFWISNAASIEKGIVHCGKFEKYLNKFRKFILPLIHRKARKHELVKSKSKNEQKRFYTEKWDSLRWKLLFKIFFSKIVMSGHGRNKKMFAHSESKSIAAVYYNRVKKAFMNGIVIRNYYLNYILFKESIDLPLYIENLENKGRSGTDCLSIVNNDVLTFLKSMPDNSISKYNLSDVFEALSQNEMNLIINEIYRTSKPNSRIILFNNLVIRNICESESGCFVRDIELETELVKQDKIFFYEGFYIYKIIK